MKSFLLPLIFACGITANAQVGINTTTPETTLDVVGKPDKPDHFDGIIPPRITGNQLSVKTFPNSKKGAVLFVTEAASNPTGQVINVTESGMYYFDGSLWQNFAKEKQPTEYQIVLSFSENSTAPLVATSTWSPAINYSGNTHAYLTATKNYTVGTKNFGGLKGFVLLRKVNGTVNVRFQIYRSYDSAPITSSAIISIAEIFSDIGYIPNQIVLLHTENSTQFFPALLENYSIHIPQASLSAMSTSHYTYGEVQGYSNWKKPYLP